MRGKELFPVALKLLLGITPAYAGKSLSKLKGSLKRGDHPRLCGEKAKNPVRYSCKLGSPPPMRGKVGNGLKSNFIHGITPAYAGKRQVQKLGNYGVRDHPRLCGEKDQVPQLIVLHKGSPPPMRGKVRNAVYGVFVFRITPAYAGKSWIPITQFFNIQDHPRLCGEKCTRYFSMRQWLGSPPPMRGKGKP